MVRRPVRPARFRRALRPLCRERRRERAPTADTPCGERALVRVVTRRADDRLPGRETGVHRESRRKWGTEAHAAQQIVEGAKQPAGWARQSRQAAVDPIYFDRTYYLGPGGGRREGLRGPRPRDGEVGSRRNRNVCDAEQAASRLPAGQRRRSAALAALLRRRDPAVNGTCAERGASLGARARDGRRADRPLHRLVRHRQIQRHLPSVATEADQGEAERP